jgi:hypothetical protein
MRISIKETLTYDKIFMNCDNLQLNLGRKGTWHVDIDTLTLYKVWRDENFWLRRIKDEKSCCAGDA